MGKYIYRITKSEIIWKKNEDNAVNMLWANSVKRLPLPPREFSGFSISLGENLMKFPFNNYRHPYDNLSCTAAN